MVPEGLQGASEVDPPPKPSADARVLPAVGSVGAQCRRVCWLRQVCLWRPPCLFARRAACSWRPVACPPSTRVGSPAPPVPVTGPRGGLHAAALPLAGCVASSPSCSALLCHRSGALVPHHQPPSVSLNPRCRLSGRESPGPLCGWDAGAQACGGGDRPGLVSGSVVARGWPSQGPGHITDAEDAWRQRDAVGRARQ